MRRVDHFGPVNDSISATAQELIYLNRYFGEELIVLDDVLLTTGYEEIFSDDNAGS